MASQMRLTVLPGMPMVEGGDDLAALIATAIADANIEFRHLGFAFLCLGPEVIDHISGQHDVIAGRHQKRQEVGHVPDRLDDALRRAGRAGK